MGMTRGIMSVLTGLLWRLYLVSNALQLLHYVDSLAPVAVDGARSSGSSSLVTGANGYVGRAVVHQLLENCTEGDEIICLVRSQRVESEQGYWQKHHEMNNAILKVVPYDMLDGGKTLRQALDQAIHTSKCVYHVASVFGPTGDHRQTALDNVKGTEDLVRTFAAASDATQENNNCKLVLTSSMAAVRASGQEPNNRKYYTDKDWNTQSELGANWGASYQWSKAASEKRAWELCQERNIPMISLCPSFVFGPPYYTSGSYSLTLVGQWARGESQVQSRLYVDIRDVAKAHVEAGRRPEAVGKRFIVSTEARVPSQDIAEWLQDVCRETNLSKPDSIYYDADFDGGAIPIGSKEVESAKRLEEELGVVLRPVKYTITDMAKALLQVDQTTAKI